MKRKYKAVIFVVLGIVLLIGIAAVSLSVYMVKATEKTFLLPIRLKMTKKRTAF